MEIRKRTEGQALIETALILVLLLLILFGITEFSRAWYTKNSLKSAARSGARVAVVTLPSNFPAGVGPPFGTEVEFACPNGNVVINTVCTSPGVKNDSDTAVFLKVDDNNSDSAKTAGDTVTIRATTKFDFVIGGYHFSFLGLRIWPWPNSITMTTDASMRYE